MMILAEETPAKAGVKFIFCDYLQSNEVVCHRTGKQLNALVSNEIRNFPELLETIENDLNKKALVI